MTSSFFLLTVLVRLFLSSQVLWLSQAYRLEFLGQSVFREVWMASLLFFVTNAWILRAVILAASSKIKNS